MCDVEISPVCLLCHFYVYLLIFEVLFPTYTLTYTHRVPFHDDVLITTTTQAAVLNRLDFLHEDYIETRGQLMATREDKVTTLPPLRTCLLTYPLSSHSIVTFLF